MMKNLKDMFVGTELDLSTNVLHIILTYIIYFFSSITQSIRRAAASIVIINRVADAHFIDCPFPLLLRLIQKICFLSFLFVMRLLNDISPQKRYIPNNLKNMFRIIFISSSPSHNQTGVITFESN